MCDVDVTFTLLFIADTHIVFYILVLLGHFLTSCLHPSVGVLHVKLKDLYHQQTPAQRPLPAIIAAPLEAWTFVT